MSKGSNTQQQNQTSFTASTPTAPALQAYQDLLTRATGVSNTPYQPFSGEEVAPITQEQLYGVGNINAASNPVSASDIRQYENPYTQDVIDATQKQFDEENDRAVSQSTGQAASQGALGGNRVGVQNALVLRGNQQVQAPIIAGLRSQGFTTAEQFAAGQRAQDIASAGQQFTMGTAEQQTQQARDTQQMTDYYTAQGYPFATAQWLAAITLAAGPAMGQSNYQQGSGTTQGPQPNTLLQGLGLGFAGLGALGQAGGSAGIAGLAALSDRRAKENIKEIGRLHDGQKVYRFNYKGHPETHVGLISQEVEKKHPGAVHKIGGFGHVDYDEATEDAVKKWSGGAITGFAGGGTPYGPTGWVPNVSNMPSAPLNAPASNFTLSKLPTPTTPDPSKVAKSLSDSLKSAKLGNLINSSTDPYSWDSSPTGGMDAAPVGAYAYADGGAVEGVGDLLSNMPTDLGPSNGVSRRGIPFTYFQGDPTIKVPLESMGNPTARGQRWLYDVRDPRYESEPRYGMSSRAPGTRAIGGAVPVSSGFAGGFADGGSPSIYDDPFYDKVDASDMPAIHYTPSTAADRDAERNSLRMNAAENPVAALNSGLVPRISPHRGLASPDNVGSDESVPVKTISYKRPTDVADTGADEPAPRVVGVAPDRTLAGTDSSDVLAGGDRPIEEPKRGGLLNFTPEGYQGLISMGLGMMANRRGGPGSFLAGVGEAGEQGLQTFASARNATIAQETLRRKEAFERQKQLEIETHNRALEQHNTALERNQQSQLNKPSAGYKVNPDGTWSVVPGGPADPEVIERGAKAKMTSGLDLTQESLDAAANNYRMTGKLPPNMGRGIQGSAQATAIKNRATQQETEAGGDPNEWPSRWQVFSTRAAGLRGFEQRAAGLTLAENEARTLLPRVREASSRVSRTDYPTLNSLMLAAQQGSGGTDVIKLGIAIESLIPVYARVLKPTGQIGVTDTQRASHLLDKAWSDGQIGAALDQMEVELASAKAALGSARKEYNESGGVEKKKETSGAGAPKVGDEKQFKQGIGVWDGTKYVPKGQP